MWIGPARRHALKGGGGRPRFLFGRLGHALGAVGPVGLWARDVLLVADPAAWPDEVEALESVSQSELRGKLRGGETFERGV